MAGGAAENEWLGDILHLDGGLDADRNALRLERAHEGEAVDDRGQHAHVVCRGAIHPTMASREAAPDVAATNHDGQLDTEFLGLGDLRGDARDDFRMDTIAAARLT